MYTDLMVRELLLKISWAWLAAVESTVFEALLLLIFINLTL